MKTMRNKILILIGIAIIASCSQSFAQTKLGGGLAYGSEIENVGINVHGEYFFNEQWSGEVGFVYFLPKNIVGDLNLKWFEINTNAHYYFDVDNVEPYAIGGLNIAIVSSDFVNPFTGEQSSVSNTEVGLNIGGGVSFDIGSAVKPFGELRYVLGDADQLVIGGGVRFNLN